jgi:pimeloyl-ACP methyl ester carboxylesterase
MTKRNKLIALLLSAVLLFGLCAPAFAARETPFENSRFFSVGDYEIHYRVFEAEEPKGQIFMIHGFALSSYCFQPLAELLQAGGYTCVIADLPDFGYSTRETEETNKLPREDIMHALMTSLSDEPWYVAGHSMGGYIAIALAEKYPESVKNLLLYGTSGNDGAGAVREKMMSSAAFIRVMGRVLEIFARMRGLVRLLLLAATVDPAFTKDYDIGYITDPYTIPGSGAGALINFTQLPVTDYAAFSRLSPVLYINAANDTVIPQRSMQKLRGYLPAGSEDHILASGGHLFIESRAEKTAELTLAFLAANG